MRCPLCAMPYRMSALPYAIGYAMSGSVVAYVRCGREKVSTVLGYLICRRGTAPRYCIVQGRTNGQYCAILYLRCLVQGKCPMRCPVCAMA
eukprot:1034635-Rhodomonas_salina.3